MVKYINNQPVAPIMLSYAMFTSIITRVNHAYFGITWLLPHDP